IQQDEDNTIDFDFSTASGESNIGARNGGSFLWDGLIDDIRIYNNARTANWITTEYNNMYSPASYLTFGTEEIYSAPSGWTGKINGVTNPAKIMGIPVSNINKVMGVE
ncbi:LamG-like jellyroll fold domain-containing protein, partial [Candidatus Omnitrophota bacterium]